MDLLVSLSFSIVFLVYLINQYLLRIFIFLMNNDPLSIVSRDYDFMRKHCLPRPTKQWQSSCQVRDTAVMWRLCMLVRFWNGVQMELLVGGDEAFPRILKTHFMKSHECGRDKPKRPQSDVCLLLRTVICYHGNCDATKIVWLTFSSMIWESFAWCPGSRQRQCAGQETGWDINCFVTLSSLWYSLSIITRGTCPSPRVTCHACLLPGDRSRLSRRWEPSWSWTVSCSGAGGASPPCKCQWSAQWLQCSYSDCLHLEHFLDLQCLLPVWECEWEEWWWLLLESISWNMDQSYFSIRSIYQVIKISTSKKGKLLFI